MHLRLRWPKRTSNNYQIRTIDTLFNYPQPMCRVGERRQSRSVISLWFLNHLANSGFREGRKSADTLVLSLKGWNNCNKNSNIKINPPVSPTYTHSQQTSMRIKTATTSSPLLPPLHIKTMEDPCHHQIQMQKENHVELICWHTRYHQDVSYLTFEKNDILFKK